MWRQPPSAVPRRRSRAASSPKRQCNLSGAHPQPRLTAQRPAQSQTQTPPQTETTQPAEDSPQQPVPPTSRATEDSIAQSHSLTPPRSPTRKPRYKRNGLAVAPATTAESSSPHPPREPAESSPNPHRESRSPPDRPVSRHSKISLLHADVADRAPGPTTRPIRRLTNSKPCACRYASPSCSTYSFAAPYKSSGAAAIHLRYNLVRRASPINAQRTSEDESPHSELPRHLQQIDAALDVHFRGNQWLALRRRRQNRRQMYDRINAFSPKHSLQFREIRDVAHNVVGTRSSRLTIERNHRDIHDTVKASPPISQ